MLGAGVAEVVAGAGVAGAVAAPGAGVAAGAAGVPEGAEAAGVASPFRSPLSGFRSPTGVAGAGTTVGANKRCCTVLL